MRRGSTWLLNRSRKAESVGLRLFSSSVSVEVVGPTKFEIALPHTSAIACPEVKTFSVRISCGVLSLSYFQKGYGIESTFLNETNMFVKWILKYYGLNDTENLTITSMVEDLNNTYAGKVLVSTDAIHEELESHFLRQKEQRKEKIYETLRFQEMLREIDNTKISYIMTKPILDMYLSELHGRIATIYGTSLNALKNDTLLDFYYNNISTIDDIYECHKELLELLY